MTASPSPKVKICGVNDAAAMDAARDARADLVGFVFVPASPRVVAPDAAAVLSARAPGPGEGGPLRVGLFVDAADAVVAQVLAVLPLDILQLHGNEDPARCAALTARFGLPVMKAVGIGSASDLDALAAFVPVAAWLLLDAKPAPALPGQLPALPGGNARVFDWRLLAGRSLPRPWLLAGGLVPGNVRRALRESGAPGVDVSSGVESARGIKDPARIEAFVREAREGSSREAARR